MRTSVLTVLATLLAAASASMTVQLCPPATADAMRLPPQPDVFEVEFGTQADLNAAIKCCFHNQTTITLAEAAAIGSRDIPLQTVVEVDVTCGGASTLTTKVRGVCAADHSIVVDPLTGVSSCAPKVTYVYENCTEGGWKTCEVDVRAPAGATVHVMPLSAAVTESEIDSAEEKLPGLLADYEETALRSYQLEAIEFPLKLVQSVSHLSLGTQDANATNVAGARSVQLKVDNTAAWLALSCQACELGTDDWVQITHEASGVFYRLTGTGAGGCVAVDQRALPVSAPELKLEAYFDQGSTQRFECTVNALGLHPPVLASSNGAAATHAAAKTKFRLAQAYSVREGLVYDALTAAQCQKMQEVRDLPAGNELLEEHLLALCAHRTDIPDIHTWLSTECVLTCPAGRRSDVQDDLRYIETRGRFRPRPQRRVHDNKLENVLLATLAEDPELRAVAVHRRSDQLRAGRSTLSTIKMLSDSVKDTTTGRRSDNLLESAPSMSSLRRSAVNYTNAQISDASFIQAASRIPTCYLSKTQSACVQQAACQWRTDRCQVAWNKLEEVCSRHSTESTCNGEKPDGACVWKAEESKPKGNASLTWWQGVVGKERYYKAVNDANSVHVACASDAIQWQPVDTLAKCQEAALNAGVTASVVSETDINYPYGCYQWPITGGALRFYWNVDGTFDSTGVPENWVRRTCSTSNPQIRCQCYAPVETYTLPARCTSDDQKWALYASDLDSALIKESSCASTTEAAMLEAYKSTFATLFQRGNQVNLKKYDRNGRDLWMPFIDAPYQDNMDILKNSMWKVKNETSGLFVETDQTRYEKLIETATGIVNNLTLIEPAMQDECYKWNATSGQYEIPEDTLNTAIRTVVFFNAVDKWLIRNSRAGWHDQCALMSSLEFFPVDLIVNYLDKAIERFYAAQTMSQQAALERVAKYSAVDPYLWQCLVKVEDDLYIQKCFVLTPQRQSVAAFREHIWLPGDQKAAGYSGAKDAYGDGRTVNLDDGYLWADGSFKSVKNTASDYTVNLWEDDGQGGYRWNKYAFQCPPRMERVEREWAAAELAKTVTTENYCGPACQDAKLDQQLKTKMHAAGQLTTDEQDRINTNKNLADPESSQSKRAAPDAGFDETFITTTQKNYERLFLVDRKPATCSGRRFGFGGLMSAGSFVMTSAGF